MMGSQRVTPEKIEREYNNIAYQICICDEIQLYIIFNYDFISKTMCFILIVKNLFSFCVEFEILLYFLLDFRLWSVNKNINMRNEVWSEMDRTYTEKSSEKNFLDRITDHDYKNCGPQY
jgi:hypothetical protein